MLKTWKLTFIIASVISFGFLLQADDKGTTKSSSSIPTIHKKAWDFDRSLLEWYSWSKPEEMKKKNALQGVAGWAEYDFDVPETGWYELWQIGAPPEWTRDIYLDGKMIARLHTTSTKLDRIPEGKRKGWTKEFNLYLKAGKHSLRYRRLGFPACMPNQWELIKADLNPFGCINAKIVGYNVLKAGEKIKLEVTGGMNFATNYEIVVQNEKTDEITSGAKVSFPVTQEPIKKTVEISFPQQGTFRILAKSGGQLSRPADLNAGSVIAIDVKNAPEPEKELKRTLLIDIDCTSDNNKEKFWEKDGKTKIVEASFGKYRESSGNASNSHWGLDGFSYNFDLPDIDHLYQLVVDYPDDDRRTMGFWVNDGADINGSCGVTLCGGVETGDRYRTTNKMLTHEAFFFPLNNKGLAVAVLNLTPGCKAAASRIRIYRIDGPLPAAEKSKTRGRMAGYFFEESGRWLRHFGAPKKGNPLENNIQSMERWGQWCRYIGANLMFPTINVYQANHYPSNILDGYFNRSYDECRMNALIAEKYGCEYVAEFHLSGQTWFEKHVMGVWTEEKKYKEKGKEKTVTTVKFKSNHTRERVLVKMDGSLHCSWKPFVYNALHPEVQDMYISVLGELADRLADCKAFAGISSRLMLSWQWMGWNALPGLKWGYGDWTIAQFEKETGIKVPGIAGKPDRFQKRFEFLTGPKLKEWQKWRCDKMFDFYKRLRNRIQKAKASAKLVLTWHGVDKRAVLSEKTLEQMKECGIRWQDFVKEPGILVVPGVMYGRRFSTPVLDAMKEERIYDKDFKTLCKLGDRGFMLYSDYFEVNDNLKWGELGGKAKYCAFDCCVPGGVNELELYALAMADSDCSFIANGGNGWMFGTPKIMQPFLKEYKALPAKQFTKSEKFSDPIAIWTLQEKDKFFFYAVNRLPYPVKVEIELAGAGKVVSASDGEELGKSWLGLGNTISFELPAFMMKSFKAEGKNVSIKGVKDSVDSQEVEKLKPLIKFAEKLRDDLQNRREAVELSRPDALQAIKFLDEAISAYKTGHYWAARGNLSRELMVRIYDMTGKYPPGLHYRKSTRDYQDSPDAPELVFKGAEKDIIGDVKGRLSSISDLCYDEKGNLFAASPEQVMEFSTEGKYLHSYRLLRPHPKDEGGIRWGNLAEPVYLTVNSMKVLTGNRLAAMCYNTPLYVYSLKDSRLLPQINGSGFQMPGNNHKELAIDSKGNLYIGCYSPGDRAGVWKYNKDGIAAYDFELPDGQKTYRLCKEIPGGMAIDKTDKLYISSGDSIYIYAENGKLLDTIKVKLNGGTGALAVSSDAKNIFAASGRYGELAHFIKNATTGKYELLTKENSGKSISTLLVTPDNQSLVIGYDGENKDGAVAVKRKLTMLGLDKPETLIKGLNKEPACLVGVSPLKVYQGNVYFLKRNKLMKLVPGSNQPQEVYDPGNFRAKVESFAFTPQGDLYLASNDGFYRHSRGTNVYLCKKSGNSWEKPKMINNNKQLFDNPYFVPHDMEVDAKGNLYIRHYTKKDKNHNAMSIYKRSPKGKMKRFCAMGQIRHMSPRMYGLYIDKSGKVYVASGATRSIACFSPKGKLIWKTEFKSDQGPGSLPIRNPIGICTDSKGNVWVTDPSANRILCFDKNGKFLKSYGHFGTIDNQDADSFCYPEGIAVVKDDNGQEWLYVADVNNQRIKKFRIMFDK